MQVQSAPSTLPAQVTTKTMTSSMSGAHALRSCQICLEEERIDLFFFLRKRHIGL